MDPFRYLSFGCRVVRVLCVSAVRRPISDRARLVQPSYLSSHTCFASYKPHQVSDLVGRCICCSGSSNPALSRSAVSLETEVRSARAKAPLFSAFSRQDTEPAQIQAPLPLALRPRTISPDRLEATLRSWSGPATRRQPTQVRLGAAIRELPRYLSSRRSTDRRPRSKRSRAFLPTLSPADRRCLRTTRRH